MEFPADIVNARLSDWVREAAELMVAGRFRHLPVVDDSGIAGIVDVSVVCRALLGPDKG